MPKVPSMKLGSLKHGRGNFFGILSLIFRAKSRRTRPKKMILAMPRTPSTKLRNSKCGQGNFFCNQPPTFRIENRRPQTKHLL